MSLSGKIAFVTGAGGGIGKVIAVSLAKKGAKVVIFGGKNKEKLLETEKEINKVAFENAKKFFNIE